MRIPRVHGIIRRRLLVNFRVDPDLIQVLLPSPFKPKLQDGYAIAGICLIRLEHIRPKPLPWLFGVSSENAAHRIAVQWDGKEGVYIPRRDTGSLLNHVAGGRLFPGEHHRASFRVNETDDAIELYMDSADRKVKVEVSASVTSDLPRSSVFATLADASSFFEGGSLGYSATAEGNRLDGVTLKTREWKVEPLAVHHVHSSFFGEFPKGSAQFDCALIMRNVQHEWRAAEDLYV